MSEAMKIRLAARCEAAGRPANEDNYQIVEDLSVSNVGFTTDKIFSLSSKGTLLLVCDGMGGMNAGEVASNIGVETIKSFFTPQLLTNNVLANDDSICAYMKRAIIKADSQIKEEASKDDSKRGMGSTVVMAWLLGHKVYVAWCGDSRCYRYNPATGLEQLSHDHSYVQDLVDTGKLLPELAFEHPNKNIVTRNLGDPRGAARPDTKVYDLHNGDVILLCSDGLSDSLRDEEIEHAISRSIDSMEACKDTLWNDSQKAGWHDNVTIVLAQIMSMDAVQAKAQSIQQPTLQSHTAESKASQQHLSKQETNTLLPKKFSKLNWKTTSVILAFVFLALVVVIVMRKVQSSDDTRPLEKSTTFIYINDNKDKIGKDLNLKYTPQIVDSLVELSKRGLRTRDDSTKFDDIIKDVLPKLQELVNYLTDPKSIAQEMDSQKEKCDTLMVKDFIKKVENLKTKRLK